MSCCGQKRIQFPVPSSNRLRSSAHPQSPPVVQQKVMFQYIGRTSIAVIGPISGIRYSFTGPGAQVEVDIRDRRSLAAVPHLRQAT